MTQTHMILYTHSILAEKLFFTVPMNVTFLWRFFIWIF
ncbi:hypothetical protein LAHI110946_00465 [Lactococcus hircilactis]